MPIGTLAVSYEEEWKMFPITGLPSVGPSLDVSGPTLELSGPTTGMHYLSGEPVAPEVIIARAA